MAPDENLVQRIGDPAVVPAPWGPYPSAAPPPTVRILVEGLPNLLHEVGHLLLRGVLDDDHGIDYRAIPFDLTAADGRAVLFEELACCTLSCGFAPRIHAADGWAWADAWFAEQLEIQPVFYGFDEDLAEFWDAVDDVYNAHAQACERVVSEAFDRTCALLLWAGCPAGVAAPAERLSFRTLLRRARRATA